ncbi:Ser-Thr-rich glycosyl-phosphatidyl-inositol-anchored membrane family-domain-containing protein [Lipomyces arxii]|uniref:Ser-Thr-rich glycosyl-phosphatidyl-inositol-anchored membrane family-domain-containing protein n=1 Tax=Lipomyces arxii TaxID=56418 RepID=UPI0034CDDA02
MARLFKALFVLCTVFAAVLAQAVNPISSPTTGDTLTTGDPFLVQWKASNNHTVTLSLLRGNSSNLQTVLTIISHLPNTGVVRWTPPTRIYTGYDYTIAITDDSTNDVNYSNQFSINGLAPVSSTTSSSTTSSSTSSTSSIPSTTSTTSSSSPSSSSTTSSFPGTSSTSPSVPFANSTAYYNSTTSGLTTSTIGSSQTSATSTAVVSSTTSIGNVNGSARLESANSIIVLLTMVLGLFALI